MAKMNPETFNAMLKKLNEHYHVFGPVLSPKGAAFSDAPLVGYGPLENYDAMVLNEKSFFSPKELFYPIRETLFQFVNGQSVVPDLDEKDLIIFLRPCDINGIERLDQIFLHNGPTADFYYARRRKKVTFFMIECTQGFDSCFCVDMKSSETQNWAAAFRFNDNAIEFTLKDTRFASYFEGSSTSDFQPSYIQTNKTRVTVPDIGSIKTEHFDHPLWKTYTDRCIACGRCNTSCITCSCFTMQDISYATSATPTASGERRRRWASCHVNGYTEMAGGHGFRKKNGERMRFKTLHKINDFHKRFGHHMCVGCGRCDDVCPEYISFSKCINKLNAVIQTEGGECK